MSIEFQTVFLHYVSNCDGKLYLYVIYSTFFMFRKPGQLCSRIKGLFTHNVFVTEFVNIIIEVELKVCLHTMSLSKCPSNPPSKFNIVKQCGQNNITWVADPLCLSKCPSKKDHQRCRSRKR